MAVAVRMWLRRCRRGGARTREAVEPGGQAHCEPSSGARAWGWWWASGALRRRGVLLARAWPRKGSRLRRKLLRE